MVDYPGLAISYIGDGFWVVLNHSSLGILFIVIRGLVTLEYTSMLLYVTLQYTSMLLYVVSVFLACILFPSVLLREESCSLVRIVVIHQF